MAIPEMRVTWTQKVLAWTHRTKVPAAATALVVGVAAAPALTAAALGAAAVGVISAKIPLHGPFGFYLNGRAVDPAQTTSAIKATQDIAQAILARRDEFKCPRPAPVVPAAAIPAPQVNPAAGPAADDWQRETQRQIKDLSKKAGSSVTLWTLAYYCGIRQDTQTLLNLSAKAAEPNANLWDVFAARYPDLSLWQTCKAKTLYFCLHGSGLVPKIIDTYIEVAFKNLKTFLKSPTAAASITLFTEDLLEKMERFLLAYNDAALAFANGPPVEGGAPLKTCLTKAIRSLYSKDLNVPEEEEIETMCVDLGKAFVDGYCPHVDGWGFYTGNKLLRWIAKKLIFPNVLPYLINSGLLNSNPQYNTAFSITLMNFVRGQLVQLKEKLLANHEAAPPPQVAGIEKLPTIIGLLQTTISFAGVVATREEIKKAHGHHGLISSIGQIPIIGSPIKDRSQEQIQHILVQACSHLFHHFSNPVHVEALLSLMMKITSESFTGNLVSADMTINEFNTTRGANIPGGDLSLRTLFQEPRVVGATRTVDGITFTFKPESTLSFAIDRDRHLEMKKAAHEQLENEASIFFKAIIPPTINGLRNRVGLDINPQELEQATQAALTTQRDSLTTIFSTFRATFEEMRTKLDAGESIHPELISLAQRIASLPDEKTLEADLDKLGDPAKKAKILRALYPVYKQTQKLTEELRDLQGSETLAEFIANREAVSLKTRMIGAMNSEAPWASLADLKQIRPSQDAFLANLDELSETFQINSHHIATLTELQTLLQAWNAPGALLWTKRKNLAKIATLIQSLPIDDGRAERVRTSINTLIRDPSQSAIQAYALNQVKTEYRTLSSGVQEQATTWISQTRERLEREIVELDGANQAHLRMTQQQLSEIESLVLTLQDTLPKVQTRCQIELSGLDLISLGAAYLLPWSGAAAAAAPAAGKLIVNGAVHGGLSAGERIAVSEAEKVLAKAYKLLESEDIYRGAILLAMDAFIKAKTPPPRKKWFGIF